MAADEERAPRTITATESSLPGAADERAPGGASPGDQRYEIVGELARGACGRILKARDLWLEREIALKQPVDEGRSRARFWREALVTAKLQHPAIVPVHEAGRLPSGESFIAMKLVDGRSLRQAIDERPTLAARLELLPSVLAIADAMAYAHSRRIIHRDLKPSNVLIGEFGETVVIDWGLAKDLAQPRDDAEAGAAAATAAGETEHGAVLGTPAYMPPEQAAGRAVDERADVYALGALLYHVVAGAPPYQGGSSAEVLEQVLRRPPPALGELQPDAPPPLVAIVDQAMQRDPARRYADARGVADDLHRFFRGQVLSLARGDRRRDPAIEAAFRQERRRQAILPVRVMCLLGGLVFLSAALAEYPLLGAEWEHKRELLIEVKRDLVSQAIGLVLVLLTAAATWTRRGRRRSDLLGVAAVLTAGCLRSIIAAIGGPPLHPLEPVLVEAGMAAYVMGQVVVMFITTALLPLTALQAAVTFSSMFVWYEIVLFRIGPLHYRNEQSFQGTFLTAIVVATVGAWLSTRLRRDEFYGRYRLDEANRRLAELERRRT